VEINSTFHRPHRTSTYARWAARVPDGFRFCLKAPKAITHEKRLVNCGGLLDAFLEQVGPLGDKLDCLLFQLPPSHAYDEVVARSFFQLVRDRYSRSIACEPRHASWFEAGPDALLSEFRVARVAADPAKVAAAAVPGGWRGLAYFRWHGAPRIYYSSYPDERLATLAVAVETERAAGRPVWCMFDNTVTGAAMANALRLLELTPRA
jgi:uncharacterized protein YecE (DUF72 family)